jgi:hypothetical protein
MEGFLTIIATKVIGVINFTSDLFTIGASGIAIYIFLFKRKEVAVTFRLLSNYEVV